MDVNLEEAQQAKRDADARWSAALEQLADASEAHRNQDRKAGWLVGPTALLRAAREVLDADRAVERAIADLDRAIRMSQTGPE